MAHSEGSPELGSADVPAALRFAHQVAGLRSLGRDTEWHERCASSTAETEAEEGQKQEIESLELIFEESLQILSPEGERPVLFQLQVPVAVDDWVELLIETGDGQVPAGAVQALPPALLRVALPPHYPLEGPSAPVLVVEVPHLGAAATELESHLSVESGVFDLVEQLKEELAVPSRLVLRQEMFSEDPMQAALRLLSHDQHVRNERRQQETQVCPVCFDELQGSRGVFLSCGHFGCRDCLQQMATLHTSEADVTALRCPVPDCRECFDMGVLRQLLGSDSELLQKYEELSLKHCIDTMEDVVYCPRCDLEGGGNRVPCIQDEDHMACCEVCGFAFCGKCRSAYHPGATCTSADDRMEALEARAAGKGREAAAARSELLTLRHLAKTTKNCPKCNMGIEKTDGCSKVCCTNCKIYFCWRCGKTITGYDHFATSECRLFDDEEIRRWNQQVHHIDKAQARAQEARFLAQFIDPAQMWQQARECPRCRAAVVRDGKNNHLRCYACMTQFCAKCFQILQKGKAGEHFNKLGSCPQHSD
ncbi:unnamed protein product [Effrenium voratum]|uniref:RBR-type E3 ubiquitin transferase n=1 Tax=Effrenium voratum TaxID=2562239 RepID=A0AA36N947_9DINO|nr:unnamed protein product [Effrenium voratum]